MMTLASLGRLIGDHRRGLLLTQAELCKKAGVSRATLDALENARAGELGFSKLTRLLTVVGLEFKVVGAVAQRPTLDELHDEDRDDQGLDRRR